eukprot:272925-Hanusia_phi.AAC.1
MASARRERREGRGRKRRVRAQEEEEGGKEEEEKGGDGGEEPGHRILGGKKLRRATEAMNKLPCPRQSSLLRQRQRGLARWRPAADQVWCRRRDWEGETA